MNFDKDEVSLDRLYNLIKLRDQKIKWNEEEIERNISWMKLFQLNITDLEVKIFFAIVDRYLDTTSFDDLNAKLEKEFKELNS